MLDAIKRICRNTQRLNANKLLHDSLDNTLIQKEIVELNQDQLYEQGVFADGTPTGDYSPNTIEGTSSYPGKKEKGQRYDHITFKDTGALYDTMRFKNGATEFDIEGNTVKDGVDLEDRYGKPITGLTDKSVGEVRDFVKPILIDKTREAILKK